MMKNNKPNRFEINSVGRLFKNATIFRK